MAFCCSIFRLKSPSRIGYLNIGGAYVIQLITPTTPDERIAKLLNRPMALSIASREGVTGMQDLIASGARELVERIKSKTKLPVAMGFGIGTPEQAYEAATMADSSCGQLLNAHHEAHTPEGRRGLVRLVN